MPLVYKGVIACFGSYAYVDVGLQRRPNGPLSGPLKQSTRMIDMPIITIKELDTLPTGDYPDTRFFVGTTAPEQWSPKWSPEKTVNR